VASKPALARLSKSLSHTESKSSMPRGLYVTVEEVFYSPYTQVYISQVVLSCLLESILQRCCGRLIGFQVLHTFRGVKIRQQVPLTTDQSPVTIVLHFIIYYASTSMKELDRDLENQQSPQKIVSPAIYNCSGRLILIFSLQIFDFRFLRISSRDFQPAIQSLSYGKSGKHFSYCCCHTS
jgi:hypothetical protein